MADFRPRLSACTKQVLQNNSTSCGDHLCWLHDTGIGEKGSHGFARTADQPNGNSVWCGLRSLQSRYPRGPSSVGWQLAWQKGANMPTQGVHMNLRKMIFSTLVALAAGLV